MEDVTAPQGGQVSTSYVSLEPSVTLEVISHCHWVKMEFPFDQKTKKRKKRKEKKKEKDSPEVLPCSDAPPRATSVSRVS